MKSAKTQQKHTDHHYHPSLLAKQMIGFLRIVLLFLHLQTQQQIGGVVKAQFDAAHTHGVLDSHLMLQSSLNRLRDMQTTTTAGHQGSSLWIAPDYFMITVGHSAATVPQPVGTVFLAGGSPFVQVQIYAGKNLLPHNYGSSEECSGFANTPHINDGLFTCFTQEANYVSIKKRFNSDTTRFELREVWIGESMYDIAHLTSGLTVVDPSDNLVSGLGSSTTLLNLVGNSDANYADNQYESLPALSTDMIKVDFNGPLDIKQISVWANYLSPQLEQKIEVFAYINGLRPGVASCTISVYVAEYCTLNLAQVTAIGLKVPDGTSPLSGQGIRKVGIFQDLNQCYTSSIQSSATSTLTLTYMQYTPGNILSSPQIISSQSLNSSTIDCGQYNFRLVVAATGDPFTDATLIERSVTGGWGYDIEILCPNCNNPTLADTSFNLEVIVEDPNFNNQRVLPLSLPVTLVIVSNPCPPLPNVVIQSLDPTQPLQYDVMFGQPALYSLGQFTYDDTCTQLANLRVVEYFATNTIPTTLVNFMEVRTPGYLTIQTSDQTLVQTPTNIRQYTILADFDNFGPTDVIINTFEVDYVIIDDPPYFESTFSSQFQIFKTLVSQSWTYDIPRGIDPQGILVKVSVDLSSCPFIQNVNNRLYIPDLSDQSVKSGSYSLAIILDDGTKQTSIPFTLFINEAKNSIFGRNEQQYVPVQKSVTPTPWSYQFSIDSIFDKEKVTLQIDLKETPQIFQKGLQIFIRDTSDPNLKPGIYKATAILSDETFKVNVALIIEIISAQRSFMQPQTNSNQNNFSLIPYEPINQNVIDDLSDKLDYASWRSAFTELFKKSEQVGDAQTYFPPTASIKKISRKGEVLIGFDKEMFIVPDRHIIVNSTVEIAGRQLPTVQISVIAGKEERQRDMKNEWELISIDSRTMKIQLTFEDPLAISPDNTVPDSVEIKFNDPFLFVSQDLMPLSPPLYLKYLEQIAETDGKRNLQFDKNEQINDEVSYEEIKDWDPTNVDIRSKFPILTQMPLTSQISKDSLEEGIQDAITYATQTNAVMLASNFVINVFLAASLNQLWSLVNIQQIFVICALFNVSLPANASLFFEVIMIIAAFEVVEVQEYLDDYLQVKPTGPFNTNFGLLGLDSLLFLNNMGSLTIVFIFYGLLLIFTGIISQIQIDIMSQRMQKLTKYLKNNLFYGSVITIIFETSLMIYLCFFTQFSDLNQDTFAQKLHFYSSLIFIGILIVVPASVFHLAIKYQPVIEKINLKQKFGTFFEDLNLKDNLFSIVQPGFFLIRRLMLSLSVTLFNWFFFGQIFNLVFQVIFVIQYVNLFECYLDRRTKLREMFNEITLLFITYCFIGFQLLNLDPHAKFQLGYVTIGIVLGHFTISLLQISFGTGRKMTHRLKFWKVKNRYLNVQRVATKKKIKIVRANILAARFEKQILQRQKLMQDDLFQIDESKEKGGKFETEMSEISISEQLSISEISSCSDNKVLIDLEDQEENLNQQILNKRRKALNLSQRKIIFRRNDQIRPQEQEINKNFISQDQILPLCVEESNVNDRDISRKVDSENEMWSQIFDSGYQNKGMSEKQKSNQVYLGIERDIQALGLTLKPNHMDTYQSDQKQITHIEMVQNQIIKSQNVNSFQQKRRNKLPLHLAYQFNSEILDEVRNNIQKLNETPSSKKDNRKENFKNQVNLAFSYQHN